MHLQYTRKRKIPTCGTQDDRVSVILLLHLAITQGVHVPPDLSSQLRSIRMDDWMSCAKTTRFYTGNLPGGQTERGRRSLGDGERDCSVNETGAGRCFRRRQLPCPDILLS